MDGLRNNPTMPGAPAHKPTLWTRTFTALTGINFGVALPFYLTMVIMTDFSMSTYGIDYGVGALSVTVFVISALVTRFLLGGKIDEWGAKRTLTIGLALNLVPCLSYMVQMPYWLLLTARVVQGVGFALSSGAAAAAAALVLPASRRAEGIGYFSMMQAFATGIGPFIAVLLRNITGDYTVLFAVTSAVAAVSLASVTLLKVEPSQNIFGDDGASEASTSEDGFEAFPGGAAELRGIHRFVHTSVLLLSPSLFLVYLGYSGVVSFVVTFANENGIGDAVGLYFVLYATAILVTRPPIGKHVDRRGERPVIYVTFCAIVAGLVVLAFSSNDVMLLMSSVLIGFGIGATQSIVQAVIARDTPAGELGRANSTFFMSMDLGAGVGPVLIGAFIPQLGFGACYIALAVASALACILYHALDRFRMAAQAQ